MLLYVPSPQVQLLGCDLFVSISLCDHGTGFKGTVSEKELGEVISAESPD